MQTAVYSAPSIHFLGVCTQLFGNVRTLQKEGVKDRSSKYSLRFFWSRWANFFISIFPNYPTNLLRMNRCCYIFIIPRRIFHVRSNRFYWPGKLLYTPRSPRSTTDTYFTPRSGEKFEFCLSFATLPPPMPMSSISKYRISSWLRVIRLVFLDRKRRVLEPTRRGQMKMS